MKKLPKILIIIFLIIFILQLASLIFLLVIPETNAADAKFTPQVSIPSSDPDISFEKDIPAIPSIAKYIKAIYNYAIGIVGILAAVVLMWGGVIWLTAGGNTERVSSAKARIGAALTGLVLALTSYMILYTINPDLVSFTDIAPGDIEEIGCCKYKDPDGKPLASMYNNTECDAVEGDFDSNKIVSEDGTECVDTGCCYYSNITMDGDYSSCFISFEKQCFTGTFYEGKKCEEIEECEKYIK